MNVSEQFQLKKKKMGHTVLKKPVKKPNKAVFKVDK